MTRMEPTSQTRLAAKRSIGRWLFNPFHYVAGGRALLVGLAAVLVTGLVGYLSKTHFDGVLDVHTGLAAPLWLFLFEGLLDWIVMGALLVIAGKVISKSRVRVLDVFGTQALARTPALVTALFALLPGYQRFTAHALAQLDTRFPDVQTTASDNVAFAVTALVMVVMIVWMVALMYRAFSVSCNVTGGKAIGFFIAAIVLGEVISKVVLIVVFSAAAIAAAPEALAAQ